MAEELEAQENTEVEEAEEVQEAQYAQKESNPDEDRAMRNGWRPKEEWGGNADDFVSAKKFNERGEMIGTIRTLQKQVNEQQRDFGSRLDNQKKLQEAQMKVAIADLETRRNDAIDEADREKANNIQGQIDDYRNQAVPEVAPEQDSESKSTALDAWDKNNSWILESTPKAAYAKMKYGQYLQEGKSTEQAISLMEGDISSSFPEVNHRRNQSVSVESGRSRPGSKPSPKLNWTQLTADEKKWYNAMPGAWKNKDDYLQAVIDERSS